MRSTAHWLQLLSEVAHVLYVGALGSRSWLASLATSEEGTHCEGGTEETFMHGGKIENFDCDRNLPRQLLPTKDRKTEF